MKFSKEKNNKKLCKKNSKIKIIHKVKGLIKKKIRKSFSMDNLPKNINDYEHILEDDKCTKENLKFVLDLRENDEKPNNKNKNDLFFPPSFYNEDLNKFQQKKLLKDRINFLPKNYASIKFLFTDKSKCPINNSQYEYELSLRTDRKNINTKNSHNKKLCLSKDQIPWNSTVLPKQKNIFDTLLPPILNINKKALKKIQDKVARPIIQIKKDSFVNGEKIKSRIFSYNNIFTLRYPSNCYPNSKYENNFGVNNVAEIRHLFRSDSGDNTNPTSHWISYLRGNKKTKMSIEDTKNREIKLRNLIREKTYSKL